jgi:hypothetical protein
MGFTRIWGLAGIWLRRIIMLAAASSTFSEVSFRAKPQRSEAEEPRISPDAPQTLNNLSSPTSPQAVQTKGNKTADQFHHRRYNKDRVQNRKDARQLPGMGDLSPLFPIF